MLFLLKPAGDAGFNGYMIGLVHDAQDVTDLGHAVSTLTPKR